MNVILENEVKIDIGYKINSKIQNLDIYTELLNSSGFHILESDINEY